jgi:hypothetical protein
MQRYRTGRMPGRERVMLAMPAAAAMPNTHPLAVTTLAYVARCEAQAGNSGLSTEIP